MTSECMFDGALAYMAGVPLGANPWAEVYEGDLLDQPYMIIALAVEWKRSWETAQQYFDTVGVELGEYDGTTD